MKKTKEAPEDEMILAELIAAASSHGLKGCKSALFRAKTGRSLHSFLEPCGEFTPSSNAAYCCVLGAQKLSRSQSCLTAVAASGNDAHEYDQMPIHVSSHASICQWNIGAAFNIAMEERLIRV